MGILDGQLTAGVVFLISRPALYYKRNSSGCTGSVTHAF